MSRVQCVQCGIAVVVDPTGTCPDGHLVGGAGVRVEQAMGSAEPHPDEPEPWVATVVLDDSGARPVTRQRVIRPVAVAGAEAATEEEDQAGDHESMMRELHELSDMGSSDPAPVTPQIAHEPPPVSVRTDAAAAAPTPAAAPPREQVAEGFAELSALEAAFHALGYDEEATLRGEPPAAPSNGQPNAPTPPGAAPTPWTPPAPAPDEAPAAAVAAVAAVAPEAPAGDALYELGDDLADFENLFAAEVEPTPTVAAPVAPTAPAPAPAPTAAAPPAPAPAPAPTAAAPAPAPAPAPPPPPAVAPRDATATPAPPPAPVTEPVPPAEPTAPTSGPLDITNFTARGGKVGAGGGRRKLFGR